MGLISRVSSRTYRAMTKSSSKKITPQKSLQKSSLRTKKRKKPAIERFHIYIYRILKQVHPDEHISSKAMNIMNSFVNDIFHRIATEAGRIVGMNGKKTIKIKDIQTATRLVLPGQLAKFAVSEGIKAIPRPACTCAKDLQEFRRKKALELKEQENVENNSS